jgi:hypothetical protein
LDEHVLAVVAAATGAVLARREALRFGTCDRVV